MGILSTIFGSGDIISKGMDLIDDIHTSDTEMIEAKSAAKTALMNSYAPFKVAQRYLALMFGLTYVVAFWMCIGLVFMDKPMAPVIDVMEVFSISTILLIIVSFYFGGGFAEGIINKRKP